MSFGLLTSREHNFAFIKNVCDKFWSQQIDYCGVLHKTTKPALAATK